MPMTCTWLASMSRSDARSTVAPAAGRNVTADKITGRFATRNFGAGTAVPAEHVPPASSTTSPPVAFWKAPSNVLHGAVGEVHVLASLPEGDMKRFACVLGLTVHVYVAGVGSTCPSRSMASTEKV